MQKQAFFPLFLGDLLTSCSEWPGEAVSLYESLLARQWFSPQRSIPSHPDLVRGLVRWDSATFDRYWPIVSRKFKEVEVDGEWRLQNPRCESHRDRVTEISTKLSESGRKGGLERAKRALERAQGSLDLSSGEANENSSIQSNPILSNPIHSEISDSPDGESSSPADGRRPVPNCPHEEIIELYHELLPTLPRVNSWPEHRRKLLKARWNEDPKRQSIEFWRALFEFIADSDFLTGRATGWRADLEWIVRPTNFAKIGDGKYVNRDRPQGAFRGRH
jgi:hypothetical protein